MAYGGDSQAEYDYGEEEYDYDDAYEEEYDAEPVQLEPGAGRASVLDASTVAEQTARLDAWEAQLQAYSGELAERAWSSWKKSAVSSVMGELQRKVVPDQWRGELQQHEQRVLQLEEQLQKAAHKEEGLLARIDELQNGPGCAREVREKLEKLKLELSQQQAKERQRSVLAQMSGSDGGVATNPVAAAAAEAARKQESRGGGLAPAQADAELLARTKRAEREAEELMDEIQQMRAHHREREEAMVATIDKEKRAHRVTRDELESALSERYVKAGTSLHEAQEMANLRIEIRALTEENEFHKAREEKVHEEENRLQMVSEMAKKLGTNVSKFELVTLRGQVESMKLEAERVHETNVQLQAQLRQREATEESIASLTAELGIFQKANDALETTVSRQQRHAEVLNAELESTRQRLELLQRQLLLRHSQLGVQATRREAETAADPIDVRVGGSSRRLPLLWGDEDEMRVDRAAAASQWGTSQRRVVAGGSPTRATGGSDSLGTVTQRAVALSDDAICRQIEIVARPALVPRVAQVAPAEPSVALKVKSNETELVAASVKRAVEDAQGAIRTAEMTRQRDAAAQELRVSHAKVVSLEVMTRASRLGALHHWWMVGAMRSFRRWAMLLELRSSYDAAFGLAASLSESKADELVDSLEAAQQQTVRALLLDPSMLGPLGELRHKLQIATSDAEGLQEKLQELMEKGAPPDGASVPFLPKKGELTQLRASVASAQPTAAATAATATTATAVASTATGTSSVAGATGTATTAAREEAEAVGASASGVDGVGPKVGHESRPTPADFTRLKMRLLLQGWRGLRRQVARQELLLRQLSSQRNAELNAASETHAELKSLRVRVSSQEEVEQQNRQRLGEQAEALSAAVHSASRAHAQHEEEVACLSEKLLQLNSELREATAGRARAQALCKQHGADLDVLMQEVVRLRCQQPSMRG